MTENTCNHTFAKRLPPVKCMVYVWKQHKETPKLREAGRRGVGKKE
jgi:hypothetical protein